VALVATQQAVTKKAAAPIKDIREDKLETVFKAYSKTAKDKVDKVDKTKLLELLAKEVIRIGLPTISKLDLKVINLLDKLVFAA
jgi:phage host-nuclease inhibitor protein Gam